MLLVHLLVHPSTDLYAGRAFPHWPLAFMSGLAVSALQLPSSIDCNTTLKSRGWCRVEGPSSGPCGSWTSLHLSGVGMQGNQFGASSALHPRHFPLLPQHVFCLFLPVSRRFCIVLQTSSSICMRWAKISLITSAIPPSPVGTCLPPFEVGGLVNPSSPRLTTGRLLQWLT